MGTLRGILRRICGDGVDVETVDVGYRGGDDIRRRQVSGSLDCRKVDWRVGLGQADDKGCHALALGHRVEKVAEQVVVVYETVFFRHNKNVDRM